DRIRQVGRWRAGIARAEADADDPRRADFHADRQGTRRRTKAASDWHGGTHLRAILPRGLRTTPGTRAAGFAPSVAPGCANPSSPRIPTRAKTLSRPPPGTKGF